MTQAGIEIRPRSVSGLLKAIDGGRFAIPRLQREFVWNGPKAAKLFDSILRGMPIGVVLIWETAKSQRLHLRQQFHVLPPFDRHNKKVWFLIDGQQRVSVIYHVREGDNLKNARRQDIDFSRVVLSLNKEDSDQQVRYRRPQDGLYLSLNSVLHPQWRQKHSGLSKGKLKRVALVRKRILGYRLFQMFISGRIDDVRETFLRINTQGMKITTADAVFTQAEGLDLRDVVHAVREHLDERFSSVGDAPLLFLLASVRGATEARGQVVEATIRKLNQEARKNVKLRTSLAKDWNRLGPSVARAVNYLRDKFTVIGRDFLASDYMLSMLAYFFFINGHGPNVKQAEQIRRWFWATSVGSRYSGRDFNRCVPQDLKFFRDLAKNDSRRFSYRPQVELADVRKAQYGSRTAITSAVYCMLLRRRPVYLLDKGMNEIPVDVYAGRANRKDKHHIFPRNPLIKAGVPAGRYNSIANICLLVADENQRIGAKKPSSYLADLRDSGKHFRAKMRRHLIPVDNKSGVWESSLRTGFKKFLQQRTAVLCRELEKEAGMRLFRREGPG